MPLPQGRKTLQTSLEMTLPESCTGSRISQLGSPPDLPPIKEKDFSPVLMVKRGIPKKHLSYTLTLALSTVGIFKRKKEKEKGQRPSSRFRYTWSFTSIQSISMDRNGAR